MAVQEFTLFHWLSISFASHVRSSRMVPWLAKSASKAFWVNLITTGSKPALCMAHGKVNNPCQSASLIRQYEAYLAEFFAEIHGVWFGSHRSVTTDSRHVRIRTDVTAVTKPYQLQTVTSHNTLWQHSITLTILSAILQLLIIRHQNNDHC